MVKVEPFFIKERSIPEQDHYFFAYKVTIHNTSDEMIKIQKRRYKIRDGKGKEKEVEGTGVVGQTPEIAPNETFTYTSYCPLETSTGNQRGYYTTECGKEIEFPLTFFRSI